MTRPQAFLARLRLDRALDVRYQAFGGDWYGAEEADTPGWIWVTLNGQRLYVEAADFEVKPLRREA